MKVIDSDHYGQHGIETFFFPGGEPHARVPKDFGDALLFLKARTWNDFGIGLMVMAALREQDGDVLVFCPYLPGARQDRTDGQTPDTATLVLRLLDDVADRIYTFDAHSSATIDRVHKNFMPADIMDGGSKQPYRIICPDKGAIERALQFAEHGSTFNEIVVCDKQRDFATGRFTGFKMPPLPAVGEYVIVDDICDGGGTFNLLAEEFLRDPYGPESRLSLFVSHGIFSKGVSNIHPKITEIFTTDSWCNVADPRLTVLPLTYLIEKRIL